MTTGFRITRGRGFHITFENGYTVSVQFGRGHYCENYDYPYGAPESGAGEKGSGTAEVAVWRNDEKDLLFLPEFEGNNVGGHYTPEMVLRLLNWAASQETTSP